MAQSLTVWNGLTKAVENDKTVADIAVRAKAPSSAWKILKSIMKDDKSERAREQAKKNFEGLSMNDAGSMNEYIARAKSLALNVQYHDIEATEQEISPRVLNGLPPAYASEKPNFALRTDFSLAELEGDLVRVEELNRSSDGTDGSHTLAAGFKTRNGGQSGRSGGFGGHSGGGRGKRDGKGRPPNQRQPQHQPRHQRERPEHQPQQQQYQPRHQREQPAHQQRHQQYQRQEPQQQYQRYQPQHQP